MISHCSKTAEHSLIDATTGNLNSELVPHISSDSFTDIPLCSRSGANLIY